MSAAELLEELNRAGAKLEFVDGKPRLRGTRIPEALKQQLRMHRAEVLAEFEKRQAEDRDRYCRVPPSDAPKLAREISLSDQCKSQIADYVVRQPRTVHAWVMARANDYCKEGVHTDGCAWRACVDLIAWQRMSGAMEAVRFVIDLPGKEELGT